MTSSPPEIPERLLRRGRPIDPHFAPDERLFLRCRKEDITHGMLDGSAIKFPDWSVNRSKYSEPEDVLFPSWRDWGIAEFLVSDIPARLQPEGGKEITFRVEHDPLEENYSHSEVRASSEGERIRGKLGSKTVKKKFRLDLRSRIRILKLPK